MTPKYKSQPIFQSYAKSMKADTENLRALQMDFFSLHNHLEKDIDTLENEIRQTDNQIAILEEENAVLKKQFTNLTGSDNAAIGMLNDTELLHNQYLFGNWFLLSVFIIAGRFVYKHRE
jgi:septal ring factor EnvC (AmiA/AmiB activator)